MRILVSALSCNPSLGSEALVGYKVVESLARKHEVTLVASTPAEAPAGVTLVSCEAGRCSFNDVGPVPLSRFEIRQMRLARALHREKRFDYIHRVTPSAIQLPSLAPLLRIPCIIGPVIAADPPPAEFKPLLRRPVSPPEKPRFHPKRLADGICRRLVERLADSRWHLRRAAWIIVGTEIARRQVSQPLRKKCVSITYAGVEHERFAAPDHRPSRSTVRLLCVGRLVPYKGIELLLRALAVASKKCELKLDLVGDGDALYTRYCRELVDSLGLKQAANFVPHVPRAELPGLYQEADIFCFPTLCDTYGIALLEAMSAGCAVIATDAGGAAEIVTPGTGVKVPLTNPGQYIRDYAEAIVGLAGNADLRARLGAAARQHILRDHHWQKIGEQLLAFYESLPCPLTK
jgi:glycosyltransferase involved in cell wall biosynthesis